MVGFLPRAKVIARELPSRNGCRKMLSLLRRKPTAEISAVSRLVPATHVHAVVHGTRTVLLDPSGGRYFGLDEVGGEIWRLAGQGLGRDRIVDQLAEEYSAPRSQIENDVDRILNALLKRRLLEVAA